MTGESERNLLPFVPPRSVKQSHNASSERMPAFASDWVFSLFFFSFSVELDKLTSPPRMALQPSAGIHTQGFGITSIVTIQDTCTPTLRFRVSWSWLEQGNTTEHREYCEYCPSSSTQHGRSSPYCARRDAGSRP